MSLSNYPPGADTPDAPWNEVDVPEREFNITITQCLSKDTTVHTNDYVPGAEGCDYEPDGEGGYCACGYHDPDDTSDTNWAEAYKGEHYTPLQLIGEYKKVLEQELNRLEDYGKSIHSKKPSWWIYRKRTLEHLIEECEGWIDDETTIMED